MPDRSRHSITRQVAILIAVSTMIRLLFAAASGLGVDESYMVASGRDVSLGYFDHPPASWWLSRGAASLFGTEAAVIVRLPFIALFALSTWLMFRLGAAIASPRAGLWAAVALNLSPVFGVTTGTWVLPDGPLDCALLGAALCLVHALSDPGGRAGRWWCGAGLCAGLALFAKYSAILTMAGAFLFLVVSPAHRHWLRRREPYVALGLAVLVFAPVVTWNATHGWASFAFQGERAAGLRFRPLEPFATLGGQALFVLPWIWLAMVALAAWTLRRRDAPWPHRLLVCLAAPPVVLFALVSAWSGQRVLFHWAAPGYLMLFPLLGEAVAQRLDRAWVRRVIVATAALVLAAVAVIGTQLRFDWLGPALAAVTRRDPTAEGINWTSLRPDLAARGLIGPGSLVGVPNWRDAGKIAYALGPDVIVLCLNRDCRQFGFAHPPAAYAGRDVVVLIPEHADRALPALAPLFNRLEPLPPSPITIGDRVLQEVAVARGYGLRAWPASP